MSDTYLITKDRVLKMMDRLDDISMMSRLDREQYLIIQSFGLLIKLRNKNQMH